MKEGLLDMGFMWALFGKFTYFIIIRCVCVRFAFMDCNVMGRGLEGGYDMCNK